MDLKWSKEDRTREARALLDSFGGREFYTFLNERGYSMMFGFQSAASHAYRFQFEGNGLSVDLEVDNGFISAYFGCLSDGQNFLNLDAALKEIDYRGRRDLKSVLDGLMASWPRLESRVLERTAGSSS